MATRRWIGILVAVLALVTTMAVPPASAAARVRMFISANPAGPAAPGEPVALTATVVGAPHATVAWSVAPAPSVPMSLRQTSPRSAVLEVYLPGVYVVTALSPPAVRSFDVRVYGPPAAVVLTPLGQGLAADGEARETVDAAVVDAHGSRVGSFVGSVTLTDTGGQLCGARRVLVALNGGAGTATLCATSRPGTDELSSRDLVAYPGALPVLGVTYGTARVADVPAPATRLVLAGVRGGMRLLVARPRHGVMAIRPVTWIAAGAPRPVTVALAVYDGAGDPLPAPRTVTLRLTGPGSLSPAAEVRTATLAYPTASTFALWSDGRAGTIAISAATAGLSTATYAVRVLRSGPPAHFQILISRGFDDRGMPYNLYDVRVVDSGRQPVPDAGGTLAVADDSATLPALSGHGHAAVVYAPAAAAGDALAYRPGPASFPVVAGSAVFAAESRPGSATPATMTITDAALGLTTRLRYVWASGRPAMAVLTGTAPPAAQVADANGNPVAEAGLPVLFTVGAIRTWALTGADGVASVPAAGLSGQPVTVSFGPAP